MKFKNKKGISPLIATVLVIGFTIVLAGVVIQFIMPIFTSAGEKAKADAALLNKCQSFGTGLTIKEGKMVGENLKIIVDNPTSAPIQYLIVKYFTDQGNAGSCKLTNGNDKEDNPVIPAGGIVSMTIGADSTATVPAELLGSDGSACPLSFAGEIITKVEITPAVFMPETKETKPCSTAVVSFTVY